MAAVKKNTAMGWTESFLGAPSDVLTIGLPTWSVLPKCVAGGPTSVLLTR